MMSISDNYRSTTDHKEILRILQRSSTSLENILWHPDGLKKNIIAIHHYEIDFVSREVVVFFDVRESLLVNEVPLYVKLDYRTSIFKVTDYRKSFDCISFPFPKNLKTLELRGVPRHVFPADEEMTVSLRPTLANNKEAGHELNVRLRDVTPFGLGLIVSEQNRSFLKSNRILWVTKMGEDQLETPILAEIQYMNQDQETRLQRKRQKELKVGLKLSGFIPDSILEKMIQ